MPNLLIFELKLRFSDISLGNKSNRGKYNTASTHGEGWPARRLFPRLPQRLPLQPPPTPQPSTFACVAMNLRLPSHLQGVSSSHLDFCSFHFPMHTNPPGASAAWPPWSRALRPFSRSSCASLLERSLMLTCFQYVVCKLDQVSLTKQPGLFSFNLQRSRVTTFTVRMNICLNSKMCTFC